MRARVAALGHPVHVFESGWQWGSIVDKSLVRTLNTDPDDGRGETQRVGT